MTLFECIKAIIIAIILAFVSLFFIYGLGFFMSWMMNKPMGSPMVIESTIILFLFLAFIVFIIDMLKKYNITFERKENFLVQIKKHNKNIHPPHKKYL